MHLDDYGITSTEELADQDLLPDSDLLDIIGLSTSQIAALRASTAAATISRSNITVAVPNALAPTESHEDLWDTLASTTKTEIEPKCTIEPPSTARTVAPLTTAGASDGTSAGTSTDHPVEAFFNACGLGAFSEAAVHYG